MTLYVLKNYIVSITNNMSIIYICQEDLDLWQKKLKDKD